LHESTARGDGQPIRFRLEQNYPNPFNTSTTIRYFLDNTADVTIKIYNIQGELIRVLLNKESISAGFHNVTWNGENERGMKVSSSIFFYQLNVNESSETKKMLLLK
jgi:flagellar hook assembly protein FlgD